MYWAGDRQFQLPRCARAGQSPDDAEDVAAALKRLGFSTNLSLDADRAAMEKAVEDFASEVEGADVVLTFCAGRRPLASLKEHGTMRCGRSVTHDNSPIHSSR